MTKSIHSFPLRFKVEYYQDDGGKVSDGEIMMIRPRGPCKGDQSEVKPGKNLVLIWSRMTGEIVRI